MPQLKMQAVTTHIIDYMGWDAYIKEMFPKAPYDSIISEEELNRGATWVHNTVNLNDEDLVSIENYLSRKGANEGEWLWAYDSIHTKDILNYLVYKGHLPKGHYTITVPH